MLEESYPLGISGRLTRLQPELADAFAAAFSEAEPDLRVWMPSAAKEQEDAESFIAACVDAFAAGTTYAYAIVDAFSDVAGYANVSPTDDHAVVAYWVRPRCRGKGLAAIAVSALVDATFAAAPDVARIHAHLDAANGASRSVLHKAGFHLAETFTRPPRTPLETDTEWLYVRPR